MKRLKPIFKKYEAFLMILVGIINIRYQMKIYSIFPILFGLFMLERGIHGCVVGWRNKDFQDQERMGLELYFLVILVAVGIMVRRQEAVLVAAMFWGISGLYKSAKYLNEILYEISNKEKIKIRYIIAFAIELVLSMILIFEPAANLEAHIRILGIQLIVEGVFVILHKSKERIVQRVRE